MISEWVSALTSDRHHRFVQGAPCTSRVTICTGAPCTWILPRTLFSMHKGTRVTLSCSKKSATPRIGYSKYNKLGRLQSYELALALS
jgi:hypothetical protein